MRTSINEKYDLCFKMGKKNTYLHLYTRFVWYNCDWFIGYILLDLPLVIIK